MMAKATRKQLEQALQNPNVRKFLDLISYTEGTQGNGYRTAFGGGKLSHLNDHPRYLKSFRQTDGKSNKTSAAGRYQFVSKTWDGVARQYGLRDFSPQNQDLGAVALLFQRGAIPALLKGDYQTAIKKTGDEWASLPSSNYKQNKRSWDNVNKFLGGKIGNVSSGGGSYQQQAPDPRLSMSAPDLLANLRKANGKRTGVELLHELSTNNGQAGREIGYLRRTGATLDQIASQLGIKLPTQATSTPTAAASNTNEYDDVMSSLLIDEPQQAITAQSKPQQSVSEYDDVMSGLMTDDAPIPQQAAQPMQTTGQIKSNITAKEPIQQQMPAASEYDDVMSSLTIEG